MRTHILAAAAAVALAFTVGAANADEPASPVKVATLNRVVAPGETVRWRSRPIGAVQTLSLTVAGRDAFYAVEPRTRSCVAYGYEAGVALRMTDCTRGRRVPYVRVRATSVAARPVRLVLRLVGRP